MFKRNPKSDKKQEIAGMSGRRFLYHAHGSAIAGTITQPFKADIDTSAATSLPIIGGFASAKSGAYELKDVISYSSAHTYVSGIQTPDGAHNTVVTCVVEGLNILHMITADAIVGRVSAKNRDGEPSEIIPFGSSFENLKIAGQPVEVDLDHDLFLQHPTHAALSDHYESAGKRNKGGKGTTPAKARYQWGASNEEIPAALAKGMMMDPAVGWSKSNGVLHTSMVKQVRAVGTGNPAAELPYAYAIHIPHVGNLYLGEIFASSDIKRLTMLRLELGSPFAGMVAASEPAGGNGNLFP
jgi:hypothetical protein